MTPTTAELLDRIEASLNHGEYRVALEEVTCLMTRQDTSSEDRLTGSLHESYIHLKLGDMNKASRLLEDALRNAQIKAFDLLRIYGHIIKAEISWRVGNIQDGISAIQECKALIQIVQERVPQDQQETFKRRLAEMNHNAGILFWYAGDLDNAMVHHQESRTIYQELDNAAGVANSLNNIGLVLVSKSELDRALEFYQRALLIQEEIGNDREVSRCLNNIGIAHTMKGDLDKSHEYFQRSLQIKERYGDRQDIAQTLINLGVSFQYKGDLTRSLEHYQKALETSEEIGAHKEIALALNNIANIHSLRGDLNLALVSFQRSYTLYQEAGMKQDIGLSLLNLGDVFRKKGDLSDALLYFRRSLEVYQDLDNDLFTANVLYHLIGLACDLDDQGMANRYLDDLDGIRKQTENKVILQRSSVAKAMCLRNSKHMRDKADAKDILEQVLSEEVLDHSLTVDATILICDLLLAELRMSGEKVILERIKSLIDQFLEIANQQSSHTLMVETYLLQSKLALIDLDMTRAKELLAKASIIAEEKDLRLLGFAITREQDGLQTLVRKWEQILRQNPSTREMIDITGVDHLLERMIQKTVSDILDERGAQEAVSLKRTYRLIYLDTMYDSSLSERDKFRVGIAQVGRSQSGDIFGEFYAERSRGIYGIRDDKVKFVEGIIREMVVNASEMAIDLLIFPELSVDLAQERLFDLVTSLSRDHQMHIIPGSYHDLEKKQNVSVMISPDGILWQQRKYIPAV
ncbi:MAG: tetratricopeptide repeat protein, partial [Anaerolineales bacterium]